MIDVHGHVIDVHGHVIALSPVLELYSTAISSVVGDLSMSVYLGRAQSVESAVHRCLLQNSFVPPLLPTTTYSYGFVLQ